MVSTSTLCYETLLKDLIDRDLISNIARKQTKHTPISWEDAAQSAYEKLWRVTKAGRFQVGTAEDFYRWAVRVSYFAIIDYLREQQSHCRCISLDQPIPGTDIFWLDTLADDFDDFDACDRADLVLKVVTIIAELDQRYPKRGYLKVWQGLVQDKTQTQIAKELELELSDISKRWKKIRQHVATIYSELEEYPQNREFKDKLIKINNHRCRSEEQW